MHSQQENYLSFSNITHNMKARKASPGVSHCRLHPDKRVRYRDLDSYQSYCTTCAVQEASRGARIEEVNPKQDIPSVYRSLSIIYERSQQNIRAQIETYNSKHQQLVEALTDMQIRDLLIFNKSIEEVSQRLVRIMFYMSR